MRPQIPEGILKGQDFFGSDDEDEPDNKRQHLRKPMSESGHGTSQTKSGQQHCCLNQNTGGQNQDDQVLEDA